MSTIKNSIKTNTSIDLATAIDQTQQEFQQPNQNTHLTTHHRNEDTRQLNTLQGVVFPSLQSILGVLLFLRLTHITSQAGCIYTTLLLLLSTSSTLFTWSSLSAIVTNGQIQNGGPYYILSRTLGVDIGCSLGIMYYIGNTLSGGMYVLGAVEAIQYSIRAYYARWGYGFSGHIFPYDVQALSFGIVTSMAACVHVGTNYVTLFSNLFLAVTLISILCMCLGCALFALGVEVGNLQPYDRGEVENLWPRYEKDPYTGVTPDFFSCLGEFVMLVFYCFMMSL
jgi:potassium/chloride transporter 4/5/6